jgi:glycosyltransferase involved in cell wall biosynthesis
MQDADVIWATLPTMLGLMAIEINGGRKPCVVQLVGDPRRSIAALSAQPSTKLLSIAAAYLVRRAISKADGAIFVSQALRSAYLADPRQRAVVVNESRVRNAQIIHQDTLAEVQRASQGACPSLVYVGRLSPEKGVAVLLKALAAVSRAKLTIIGSGPQRGELEGLAARLGIADRVCFLGSYPWGSDLLELIRRHQCLVLPSFTEGLPLVLMESMSQGVPVIASSVGGIPEVVRHGVNGLLFPRGDVSALAAAIDRVISDPGLRYELALAGLCVAKLNTSEIQYGNAVNFILETVALRSSK